MKVQEIIEDLEFCKGIFDYTISPNEITKLVGYIKELQQESNQLKEQYCERNDCSGRLGNSRKVERLIQENEKLNHYKKLYQILKREKEELRSWLKKMLDNEKDIFSVVRVKDVLSKLNELEGGKNE